MDGVEDAGSDELDGMRIRRLAALRRAAYRSRSYCLIALGVCLVGAVQLVINAIHRLWLGGGWVRPVLYVMAAAGLLALGTWCAHLAVKFGRQAKQSSILPPTSPPDFSILDDGSQRTRHLEQL
ncbi:MAG: hypothetical protein ABR964_04240 [Tepidisphaeraceae bacterium]|jgi:hypothetical protein